MLCFRKTVLETGTHQIVCRALDAEGSARWDVVIGDAGEKARALRVVSDGARFALAWQREDASSLTAIDVVVAHCRMDE